MFDVLIIGAGITGCFLAHELSEYELKTAVLERENDVACGSTMANSAIIHAGNDPEDGTLKARLNLEGSRQYEAICERLHVPYRKTGSFTVSSGAEEERIEGDSAALVGGQPLDEQGLTLLDAVLLAAGLDDRVGHRSVQG